ncbi:hypothetical protein [Spiroplasma endosymbiont of Aspidapion aeneum]|uniref:hypothetical protein n=1 Tax=Spiroplasma endosymbiont of Aspidapion aeneum TaxID=3066276 RepID=UPI00313E5A04
MNRNNMTPKNLDDNFWFDEITEVSLDEPDILSKTKPTINLVQNPNYHFMNNNNKQLNIKKGDLFNIPKYSSIDIIPNDDSIKSKLPKDIIELRKKSQTLSRQQLESLIDNINDNKIFRNYNVSDNFETEIKNEQKNKPKFSYTESDQSEDLKAIVKDIKKEILHELLEEVRRPSSNIDTQLITQEFFNRRIKKVYDKLSSKQSKKSVLELTKESKYSFEKKEKDSKIFKKFDNSQNFEEKNETTELTNMFDGIDNINFNNNHKNDTDSSSGDISVKKHENVNIRNLLGDE